MLTILLAGCAGSTPQAPYPAFMNASEAPEIFLAELPGVRARRLAVNADQRTGHYLVDLPVAWTGSSSASPGKALEIFVLAGQLSVGSDLVLGPAGYAYLPPGGMGVNLRAYDGARVLYRISDPHPNAVIQTPILLDSNLLAWQPTDLDGEFVKELRFDPGSQQKTWLRRIAPGTSLPWRRSLSATESYLVSGDLDYAECVNGAVQLGPYLAGGYIRRPADVSHGGPASEVRQDSVWLQHESVSLGAGPAAACASP
ncbi:MAG: hypothetical protein AAGA33_09670 [Pseudomonadota bacterium]